MENAECTFFFAVSASLQAELYMSIVCFSSSLSLFISASTSSYNFSGKFVIYILFFFFSSYFCMYVYGSTHTLTYNSSSKFHRVIALADKLHCYCSYYILRGTRFCTIVKVIIEVIGRRDYIKRLVS